MDMKTEISIIKLLVVIFTKFYTISSLRALDLFEVKTEILRYLTEKFVIVIKMNDEIDCMIPLSSELENFKKIPHKDALSPIFTDALITCKVKF